MKYLTIFLILVACGKKSDSRGDGATDLMPSLALDKKEELPTCDDSRQKQLVYVVDEKIFYTCKGSDWEPIDVTQTATTNTTNVNEFPDSAWVDNVTGYTWHKGFTAVTWAEAMANCNVGAWTLGTRDEATSAVIRGLGVETWTSTEFSNPANAYYIRTTGVTTTTATSATKTDARAVACVKK